MEQSKRLVVRLFVLLIGFISLFSSGAESADLEPRIQGMFGEFKTSGYVRTANIRPAVAFVGDLHQKLLISTDEGEVQHLRKMISAIIGSGTGVGGLRRPKSEDDKSYKVTPQERAIMLSAIVDAERVSITSYDHEEYFGQNFILGGTSELIGKALDQHARSVEKTALGIFSFKESMNGALNPDRYLQERRHDVIQNINFSNRSTPAIHQWRLKHERPTRFDAFLVALAENKAMEEVLTWHTDFHALPLVYLSIHGGAEAPLAKQTIEEKLREPAEMAQFYPYWLNLIPTLADPVLKKAFLCHGLLPKERLSEEGRKQVFGSLNGMDLDEGFYNLLLEKKVLGPEEALFPTQPTGHLPNHVWYMRLSWAVGHVLDKSIETGNWAEVMNVVSLPDRTQDDKPLLQSIRERALVELLDAASKKKIDIWDVMHALDMGIRYGGNVNFYFNALWHAYQTALRVYVGDSEGLMNGKGDWKSGLKNLFFSGEYTGMSAPEKESYHAFLNKITQDLFDKNYLDSEMIKRLSEKYWIKPELKKALLQKGI